ncbi:MAG: secretin and TonB N-terminal domain-containing protein [Candidatus Omnitrophica bacterium]|nr:secretin and TonB N-terminal domain-containing protein [Candidatus Omnitrophota bacterium]
MKKVFVFTVIAFSLIIATLTVQAAELAQAIVPVPPAQQQKITALSAGMEGNISLDLRNIEINDALKYFALKSGMNIVTSKSVTGRITLVVGNVPVKNVLDIMLRSNGLAYDKVGDIYNVMSKEEYSLLYGKNFADVREVKVFRLKYAVPEQIFSLLDTLKSDVGQILVDSESGSALCMDSPDKLKEMEKVLNEFEKENLTRVFPLNYAKAKTVEEQLSARLDAKKVGSIKADERANQVIVQAFPARMQEIERLIKALDKKTMEVLIDAKIVKVNLGDGIDVGVKWEGLFDLAESSSGMTYLGSTPFATVRSSSDDWQSRKATLEKVGYVGSYPSSGTTSNYSASTPKIGLENLNIGVVGSNDFNVLMNYLKTENEAKILSNPKIAVVNNQESRIHVGAREAYVTTTTSIGQSTNTISEQVNFIDTGLQMDVIPTINDDGFISLKLKTEVSSVINTLVTSSNNRIPIVDTSVAETTVLVKDGGTIIIGGLRKEEKIKIEKRVPILSKIPVLGQLFKTKNESNNVTELLIMLTPTIISGEALITAAGEEVGSPGIKPAHEYQDSDRIKKEQNMSAPCESDSGAMEIKGFKVYKGLQSEEKK